MRSCNLQQSLLCRAALRCDNLLRNSPQTAASHVDMLQRWCCAGQVAGSCAPQSHPHPPAPGAHTTGTRISSYVLVQDRQGSAVSGESFAEMGHHGFWRLNSALTSTHPCACAPLLDSACSLLVAVLPVLETSPCRRRRPLLFCTLPAALPDPLSPVPVYC